MPRMTNVEATWHYRREVAQAISHYSKSLRKIWEAHNRPLPPYGLTCASAMIDAWATLRVQLRACDARLEALRRIITDHRLHSWGVGDV